MTKRRVKMKVLIIFLGFGFGVFCVPGGREENKHIGPSNRNWFPCKWSWKKNVEPESSKSEIEKIDPPWINRVIPELVNLGWLQGLKFIKFCAGSLTRVRNQIVVVTNAICAERIWHQIGIDQYGPAHAFISETMVIPISDVIIHSNFTWCTTTKKSNHKTSHDIAVVKLKFSDKDKTPDLRTFRLPQHDENAGDVNFAYVAQTDPYRAPERDVVLEIEAKSKPEKECEEMAASNGRINWEPGAWLCIEPQKRETLQDGFPFYIDPGKRSIWCPINIKPNEPQIRILHGVYTHLYHNVPPNILFYQNVAHYLHWIESAV